MKRRNIMLRVTNAAAFISFGLRPKCSTSLVAVQTLKQLSFNHPVTYI